MKYSYRQSRSKSAYSNYNRSSTSRHDRNRNGRSGYGRPQNSRQPNKLDAALFVKKAVEEMEHVQTVHNSFSDFDISSQLKSAIQNVGYTSPTSIQDQCIPHLLEGRDVLGIAHTGSGKTAAFLIPLIDTITKNASKRALIIAPTRELALQIEKELRQLTKGMTIHSLACIGGVHLHRQTERLRRKPHFVIGTPGRLLDLEKRHAITFKDFSLIVLDEVDRMLDMGFIKDITHIIGQLPEVRQSLFFSATLPQKMNTLVESFLHDPVTIKISSNAPSTNVEQNIITCTRANKLALLEEVLSRDTVSKTIVFGRTKWGVKKLARHLAEKGFKVTEIHGNRTQNQRQVALDKFRNHDVNVLLATDVAARGIDVNDISHVINYDAPESYDDYIHRIGRTGRAGKKGIALTFVESH